MIDKLLAEIKETKRFQMNMMDEHAKLGLYSAEYFKGYICALSYVEGLIAVLELKGEIKHE